MAIAPHWPSAPAVGASAADIAVTAAMLPSTTATRCGTARICMMVPFPGRRSGEVENVLGSMVVSVCLYRRLGGSDLLAPIGHGQRDRRVLDGDDLQLDEVVGTVRRDPDGGRCRRH